MTRLSVAAVGLVLVMSAGVAFGQSGTRPRGPLPEGAEAWSLFGDPLVPPTPARDAIARMHADLHQARANLELTPNDPEAIIWVARRLGYLGRYREAIATLSDGLARHPDDARLLRHRGHRYISIRDFVLAKADLARAAALVEGKPDEIEPDGQPNARNQPTSTLHSNIWYHLALARYLNGEFEAAAEAYRACLTVSTNPDMLVATTYWAYLTLRRLGQDEEAAALLEPITPEMDIIENQTYHRLLLAYKAGTGVDTLLRAAGAGLDRVTTAYGVGTWYFLAGRTADAERTWRLTRDGASWAAFGAIAAEAELYRLVSTR